MEGNYDRLISVIDTVSTWGKEAGSRTGALSGPPTVSFRRHEQHGNHRLICCCPATRIVQLQSHNDLQTIGPWWRFCRLLENTAVANEIESRGTSPAHRRNLDRRRYVAISEPKWLHLRKGTRNEVFEHARTAEPAGTRSQPGP